MDIVIKQIASKQDLAEMMEVWQQVFERELGVTLPRDSDSGNISHWLARSAQSSKPVGTLSVVETTGRHQLHDSLGLGFDAQARIARFMHLAVLKPYRGMQIPLAMMLEAHRSVIVPCAFDHTWLLFDVARASGSFLTRQLGFTVLPQTFVSEYGCRCPLVRNERAPEAQQTIREAKLDLRHLEHAY